MNKRKIIAVWAEDENGLIGKDNGLPWKKPEDLKHFKETTINKIIVMSSKTFEGLRKKTLPNRTTIILTRDLNYEANGAIICNSIDEVLKSTNDDLYIVGVLKSAQKVRLAEKEALVNAGRDTEKLDVQLEIIESLLPAQMSYDEIVAKVKEIIANAEVKDRKLIGIAQKELKGKADGKLITQIVNEELNK